MIIYHNPRCRKSRDTLALIEDAGIVPEIVEYLKEVPSEGELRELLRKLSMRAEEIIRKGEPDYKEHYKGKQLSENEWISAMVAHPKLIERPIVVRGERAVLGRPPENVTDLF
ncbi:MAG: arsenate reductase (glutaredoxin) [Cryomorphaceae bacterium]